MKGNGNNGHGRLAGLAIRCQPDSRLVRLVREGHDPAFEEIVRRYRAPLVTYAGGIVPDHHAEDVVQEALTRAHAALGRSDAEMNLKPWLFTIVRNGALNSLRNEPVHAHLDENYDGVPQPPDVAARREELAALTARVKGLPEPQREAIVKRELEGRSHEEIAMSLGVSAGAVRGLIYRARATLRDGAGMLIPLPVLRALLSSGSVGPEATGAAGAAAAGLAGGGGGVALKAGATLGVAVLAVGSGIAIQHRDGKPAEESAAAHSRPIHPGQAHGAGSNSPRVAGPGAVGSSRDDNSGESSGDGNGESGSSGPGPGSGSKGSSSGEGSGSGEGGDDSGHGGPSPSGDDGGGGETSGGDDGGSGGDGSGGGDGGGTTTDDSSDGGSSGSGSGSSGSGSGDDESSGSGSSGSGSDDSGSSGSGDETTTTTTTTTDGGTSGSG